MEQAFIEKTNPDTRRVIYSQWLTVKHLLLIMAANNPERKEAVNTLKETFMRYSVSILLPIEESLLHKPLLDA